MSTLLALAALVLGAAAAIFYNAHGQIYYGTGWAVDVCTASPLFCGHWEYLAYAAAGSLVLAIGVGLGSALSGD
ncbi:MULTISPECIES: hypothetical protein [Rhodopseudomonas]|uniref:Transmembrane protein n=1 Tax=Rhodopseudomonas palustris TaxID=1076 RepID=A0A0D7ELS0_RHOPL|nr:MULTISPECIES: hypothetical protein [Rhodopseudomonas]KIZ41723.1 hypothetical protein OO17_14290 [Rhodopseudomonas palustris]MDF3809058.1 hypothetical protein [Rhodopseudomonas sp. BAL398]WOK18984.1 hypothetical protein RBJ75_05545 [Rhodopseudomonas sp. BAL398]